MKKILLALIAAISFSASAMEMEVRNFNNSDNKFFALYGKIERGDLAKFKKLYYSNSEVKNVLLSSYGGYVYPAMDLAKFIREKGLDTKSQGICESACTLIFMGGNERYVSLKDKTPLGFHLMLADFTNADIRKFYLSAQWGTYDHMKFVIEMLGEDRSYELADLYQWVAWKANENDNAMVYPNIIQLIQANIVTRSW